MKLKNQFKIRKAQKRDISSLSDLLIDLFSIETDFVPDEIKQKRGLELVLTNPDYCIMIAEKDSIIAGMVSIQTLISTAEGGKVGILEDMVILEQYRGQGIGSLLISSIIDWAKENNLLRIQLLADKKNDAALDFYKKTNWNETDLICLRYKM